MSDQPLEVTIRKERAGDEEAVRAVVEAAFGRELEADIVDDIRGTADWFPDGSLVAIDAARQIVGHVLLSRGRLLAEDGSMTYVGVIGPVAVDPLVQKRGVGIQLMRRAISAGVQRHLPVICLLGHPTYYPKFKFQPARAQGFEPPTPNWPDEAWMALRLPDWTPTLRGVVHFPPAFGEESS
ncbi:MAG TPA: N-acetyltransferase [Candidatus Limnocylindrales bacterium]